MQIEIDLGGIAPEVIRSVIDEVAFLAIDLDGNAILTERQPNVDVLAFLVGLDRVVSFDALALELNHRALQRRTILSDNPTGDGARLSPRGARGANQTGNEQAV
jgi:hypothetical protein